MQSFQPIVVGGNGHSGTRIFIDIIEKTGTFCGIRRLTKRANSSDLRMIDLLNRWSVPYVFGRLSEMQLSEMRDVFARRLRLLFPYRGRPWGFKNPRCMLILPVLHQIFPGMKFVHVIRDGRDIALGNELSRANRHVAAFLERDEAALPPEQQMILFWGRSNERAMEYGTRELGDRYRLMRWEELCMNAREKSGELAVFAGASTAAGVEAATMVRMPASIGRWRSYPREVREPVATLGAPWLRKFGYD